MKYLIFLDIDGTVMSSKGFHPRTVDAIAEARKKGHMVFINTGRANSTVYENIRSAVNPDGIISSLGSLVKIGDEVLYATYIPDEITTYVMDFCKRHSVRATIGGENHSVSYCGICFLGKDYEIFSLEDMYNRFPDIKVAKFSFERHLTDEEVSELSKYFTVYNHTTYSEVTLIGNSKAAAMEMVRKKLGVDLSHVIAMGDSDNDTEMLEAAGIAVVMGNAPDYMKEKADFVTLHCDDGGVGYAIEKLVLEKEEDE
ncbi:MAG: HAD family phosphatase [Ruminococcaceae bacterium]|nr:HAD family phosphatase [Oscillospiraceae bacterium]